MRRLCAVIRKPQSPPTCISRPAAGRRPPRGFSLVEVLVVIAIVGALLTLLMPAVQAARRATCTNNLRQLGAGLLSYHDALTVFPSGALDRKTARNPQGKQLSWNVLLLPFIEEQSLARRFDLTKGYSAVQNRAAAGQRVSTYECPSTALLAADRTGMTTGDLNRNGRWDAGDDLAFTDYGGNFGFSGLGKPYMSGVLLYETPVPIAKITDGTAHTIIVAEDTGRGAAFDGQWANGENIFDTSRPVNDRTQPEYRWHDNEMWSDHPGGANVLLCDGSVRFVAEQLDLLTLAALCTRAGDEVVDRTAIEDE
jgi:prepilin-type N-terminal cleavage/methylation domain-containing protein/prepilin-type processing-associated H-X9-DG protein